MSKLGYRHLDHSVYYGDQITNIKQFEWFDTFPFKSKKQFVYILRTPLSQTFLRNLLLDLFPKIFSCDIRLDYLIAPYISVYTITFTLYYDNFWDEVVDKLFLFCMSYLNTMDFHILSPEQNLSHSFEDNFQLALYHKRFTINPNKFFNSGMAKLFQNKKFSPNAIPLWGSITNDLEAIRIILTFPRNLRKVLLEIPEMNCTEISQAIFDEYSVMRRTL